MSNSSSKAEPRHPLIFLHIPKTGGTTLWSILKRNYRSAQTLDLYQPEKLRSFINRRRNNPLPPDDTPELCMGHFSFGIHRYLGGNPTYVTLLREPVDRIISWFYYVRELPEHDFGRKIRRQQLTLEEVARNRMHYQMCNAQTRLLSTRNGFYPNLKKRECLNRTDLERAKKNLEKQFSESGILEQFDAFLLCCFERFNWDTIRYSRWNVSQRPGKETVSQAVLEQLHAQNELDQQLYTFCKNKFRNRIKEYRGDLYEDREDFEKKKNKYQKIVKCYQLVKRLGKSIFDFWKY